MKTDYIELYTYYLISNNGKATETGLSAKQKGTVSPLAILDIGSLLFFMDCSKSSVHFNFLSINYDNWDTFLTSLQPFVDKPSFVTTIPYFD